VGIGIWAGGAALFVTVAIDSVRNAVLAGVVAAGGLVVVWFTQAGGFEWETMAAAWAAYSFDWTVAFLIRIYRSNASRAETRAALFAADREARAREAVSNERARLARELHDSVGHALNVVVLQSAGAQRVLEKKPDLAGQALTAIETAGRQALADIERMLGILRAESGEEAFDAAPGLARLDDLFARVREAGLPVEVVVSGEPHTLPPSLDLSAYRIIQEALTNTLKHAGKAHSRVTLRWTDEQFAIEVVDDGRGAAAPPTAGGGRGLLGIRERVVLFGGELLVGPRPEGGFGVWARLPLADPTAGLTGAPGVAATVVRAPGAARSTQISLTADAATAITDARTDETTGATGPNDPTDSTNPGGTA
jgi:signal transduction histidine kinase